MKSPANIPARQILSNGSGDEIVFGVLLVLR